MAPTREDWLGWLVIGLCVVVVASAFGVAAWIRSSEIEVDPETLCPLDLAAPMHVVFLIDKTDPLTERLVDELTVDLLGARRSLAAGERLSVFLIDDRVEETFAPLFSRCSPGRAEEANELYENPRMIQRAFDEAFGRPVDAALTELVRATTAPRSPIFEAVQQVGDWPPCRDAARRRLVLVSDLLQNVDELSLYGTPPPFSELMKQDYLQRMLPDLRGVEVSLHVVRRSTRSAKGAGQASEREAFWQGYFAAAGARLTP